MVDKKVVETRYAHDSWGITICCVASFAEAWIEKNFFCLVLPYNIVASFAEAWIEKNCSFSLSMLRYVASFAEAWIENFPFFGSIHPTLSRLLRGGVD